MGETQPTKLTKPPYPVNVTVSERLAIGKAMEEELTKRHGVRHDRVEVEKFPPLEVGKSRDLVAERVGMGSGR